jgi:hypothetical protein
MLNVGIGPWKGGGCDVVEVVGTVLPSPVTKYDTASDASTAGHPPRSSLTFEGWVIRSTIPLYT